MGIFDWLKTPKSNVDLLDEVIWLTKQAKFTGISASIARCLANQPGHLPCCWWPTSGTVWTTPGHR